MRDHIRLIETLLLSETSSAPYYVEGSIWLHGGPDVLRGGHFERRGRLGRDMGGLFFVREDTPRAWETTLGYTMRYRDGAIWRCRIEIEADDIFNLMNETHVERLRNTVPAETVNALLSSAKGGHLPWARTPEWQQNIERLLRHLGFKGYVVQERGGASGGIISLCVFNPLDIKIIGKVNKAEVMATHGNMKVA